jgi:DNA-binding NarL/FixJ family response regulator
MNIIFIDDDEIDYIEVYVDDLKIAANEKNIDSLSVLTFDKLDEAYQYLEIHDNNIDIVILDIMMPGGEKFYSRERDPMGLKSGFYFYQEVRNKYPNLDIRFFTNVTDSEMEKIIRDDPNSKIYYKDELLPFELTKEILG